MPAIKKTFLYFLLLLLILSNTKIACAQSVEKQALLTALTFNIARFTQWPKQTFNKSKNHLNLCVYGDNVVQQSFANIDNKLVNNRQVKIINTSRLRNLNRCQILYISELEQNKLRVLLRDLQHKAVLTIGENMAFLQAGGIVGLEMMNEKIQLSINLPIAKQSKLLISSRLLKLANIVDFHSPFIIED